MGTFALKSKKVLTPLNVIEDGIVVVEGEKIKYVGRQSNIPVPQGVPVIDAGEDVVVRIAGIDRRKGSLECGKDADITVVDGKFNVKMTLVRGRKVYEGAEGRK